MVTFSELGNFGRLGNQLFQIAATIGIAKRNNTEYYFPNWAYSKFFSTCIPVRNEKKNTHRYSETSFSYQDVVLNKDHDWDLYGYFQSERYFSHCSNAIRNYFTFRKEIAETILFSYKDVLSTENVSVHIRRGDYLTKPDYHTNLSVEWYDKALSFFSPGITKIIFSDDIPWCKETLKWDNIIYTDGNECEDILLMSLCMNNIIANSSFSWWGAWLNENESKKVIAPVKWFGPATSADTKDITPPTWIRI
jgi:hypothetical protein